MLTITIGDILPVFFFSSFEFLFFFLFFAIRQYKPFSISSHALNLSSAGGTARFALTVNCDSVNIDDRPVTKIYGILYLTSCIDKFVSVANSSCYSRRSLLFHLFFLFWSSFSFFRHRERRTPPGEIYEGLTLSKLLNRCRVRDRNEQCYET